jgi:nucleoid DNA-binding protein
MKKNEMAQHNCVKALKLAMQEVKSKLAEQERVNLSNQEIIKELVQSQLD